MSEHSHSEQSAIAVGDEFHDRTPDVRADHWTVTAVGVEPKYRHGREGLCVEIQRPDNPRSRTVVFAEDLISGKLELWRGPMTDKASHCCSHADIALHLDEALAEAERAPAGTDRYRLVWGSFWDRVTEGGPIPERRL